MLFEMLNSQKFFLNGLLLTATSLIIKTVGVSFNAFTANAIGEAGTGLFSLVMSVYALAVTAASAGINLAATRMSAEADGRLCTGKVRAVMRRCLLYGLITGLASASLLFLIAEPVGIYLLDSADTVVPLKLLSVSLPFLALSAAMNGYFTAVGRVARTAVAQIAEQGIRIALTVAGLRYFSGMGVKYQCIALVLGSVISELVSFLAVGGMFLFDLRKNQIPCRADEKRDRFTGRELTRKMISITVPVAISSFVRSGLITVEHLLIPIGLKKYGATSEAALAAYGVLSGMVMPVVLFPVCLIQSFYGLLVPELAKSREFGGEDRIKEIVTRMFRYALIYSLVVAGIMTVFSESLGFTIYSSASAVRYIRIMAPLITVMYLDSAVDAMLKGLGEQVWSMRVNIADAGISTLLVWLLVPIFGLGAYIFVMYLSEIFNLALSIFRLKKVTDFKLKVLPDILLPILSVVLACTLSRLVLRLSGAENETGFFICVAETLITCGAYALLLAGTGCIDREDKKSIRILLGRREKTDGKRKRAGVL